VLTGDRHVAEGLPLDDQKLAARLFAIGGRSSNDLKRSEAQSRRIELALQYVSRLGQKTAPERGTVPFATADELGGCPLAP
jgi:hypothetical protein